MSEGNIRINKVLRELNISLEIAVDYLKDKGIVIEASPNTKVSDDVYSILCGQFAGDKGNKEASKGISEEIRKEKEALRIEREKEIEDKRKLEEERQKQAARLAIPNLDKKIKESTQTRLDEIDRELDSKLNWALTGKAGASSSGINSELTSKADKIAGVK